MLTIRGANRGILILAGIILILFSAQAEPQYNEGADNSLQADTSHLASLIGKSIDYSREDPNRAIDYGEKALEIIKKEGGTAEPEFLIELSKAYDKVWEPEKAIHLLDSAILTFNMEESGLYFVIANLRAYLEMRLGNFAGAIEGYTKVIQEAKKKKDTIAQFEALQGISSVYQYLDDRRTEEYYLNKCLALSQESTSLTDKSVSRIFLRLGDVYLYDSLFSKANINYSNSLKFARKTNDTSWITFITSRIAWTHYLERDYDSSLELFQYTLDLSAKINKKNTISNSYGNIGNIYRDLGDYKKAIKYYNLSAEMSKESGDFYNLSWLYNDISLLYEKLSDHESALKYFKLHTDYSDSLQARRYEGMLNDARVKYEADKNQKELEIVSLKLRQHRIYFWALLIGFIALIVVSVLLLRQYRFQTRQRIADMNHKISELTQHNLRQQMNPHFIFNTLNSIQYYVFQNDKIAANNYMTKFASLIRKTLENSRYPSITINEEITTLQLYLELESLRFKEKFDWEVIVDDDIDTLTYKIPTMLIQPFVENAIVHGLIHKEGKGFLKIKMYPEGDVIACSIEDNGIGRHKAMQINRKKRPKHNSLGTSITESRLKLVNSLYGKKMRIQYKDLTNDKGDACGTRVLINIPLIS